MNKKCKCGSNIHSYVQFNNFGECFNCHTLYILKNRTWEKVSKEDFKKMHRQALIELQKSNKRDKEVIK